MEIKFECFFCKPGFRRCKKCGLVCKGDGETAMRMIDVATGELPVHDKTGTVRLNEIKCLAHDCPEYQAKKCHEVMNLRFVLPEVPGLGVWQIDTGSKNSIPGDSSIKRSPPLPVSALGRYSAISKV